MTLHNKIMNIPIGPQAKQFSEQGQSFAYMMGHRDARHAAAEMAIEFDEKYKFIFDSLRELSDALKEGERDAGSSYANYQIIMRIRRAKEKAREIVEEFGE